VTVLFPVGLGLLVVVDHHEQLSARLALRCSWWSTTGSAWCDWHAHISPHTLCSDQLSDRKFNHQADSWYFAKNCIYWNNL